MELSQSIKETLLTLPRASGVYKFYSMENELLYIGKALNLSNRVPSYFRETHVDRPHIIPMIPLINRIEYIETDNEIEALVLESALIKKEQPRFNLMQKDDKSYAWVYISTDLEFPKISIVRSIKKGEYGRGRLFGPYPNSRAARQIFRYIRKIHPFCTCEDPAKPCLYVHLGLCPGPHFGMISKDQYMENIGGVIKFLEGNRKRYINQLEKKMQSYVAELNFEKAAELRDKIADLKHLGTKINSSYYSSENEYLKKRSATLSKELSSIGEDVGYEGQIHRIECYDISNIQGKYSFGSMTVSINGSNATSQYRIFKIRGKDTPDDFAMLSEVLERRVRHIGQPEADSLSEKPDIILIDGGKGQLSAVKNLIPEDIFLMGISKGRYLRKRGKRLKDQFWVIKGEETVQVRVRNPRILISLRDEAHRFALKHHRKARAKAVSNSSILDRIEGVGPKSKKALMKQYGSIEKLSQAPFDDLVRLLGNKSRALQVFEALEQYRKNLSTKR